MILIEECPKRTNTVSSCTPASSKLTENVSRNLCAWPSMPASSKTFAKLLCQSATVDFLEAVPRPEEIFSARVQLFQFFRDLSRQRQPDRLPGLLGVEQKFVFVELIS